MAYNIERTKRMKKKSDGELLEFVKSGSLSAAAAEYELFKVRGWKPTPGTEVK